ncbi:MAG: UDP-glucose/GDP-mannose dehydrogenase family protein [Deltaproteobacteria bacterium]|jgi:UDPglucose 6-dehydrogenase|nr:UDP-glucose/GDP-mannose dehydrogenase family protein [Deltaproteobacteria bacterium]
MRICVIGTGYVGLVSAACFAEMGNDVACVDVNPDIVDSLERGRLHIFEPGLEGMVLRNREEGRLFFSTSMTRGLAGAQIAFICVGTPSRADGACDLSQVAEAAKAIGRTMQGPLIAANKSTVPVGTADAVRALIAGELEQRALSLDFDVISNPEFLKEGDAVSDFMKPDRVVVGTDREESAALLRELYAPFARSRDKLIVVSARSAEMIKYAANSLLATKISFINEIATICEQVGADVREVRAGIGADHRIGHHFIYPGLGYGGSCFPKDVRAIIHTAREAGVSPALLTAVDSVNEAQKKRMALRILEALACRGGASGKTLALWGLAFKANTDDMREAASLTIIRELTARGVRIKAYDPAAGKQAGRILADNALVEIVDGQYAALQGADALLVATEWNQFRTPDFERIKAALAFPLLFDGRNLYSGPELTAKGFSYFCVGKG